MKARKARETKTMPLFAVILAFAFVLYDPEMVMSSSSEPQKVTFQTSQFEIVGKLQVPDGPGPHPAVVVVHGSGRGTRGYYRLMRRMIIKAGYAAFIWDKPGFGESKGQFSSGNTLVERAAILAEALSTLRKHPDVDPDRIGVWGVSQAGYVIPLALDRGAEIAFVILVGAAGENGIQQTAYFVGQQVLCAGFTREQAAEADSLAAGVMSAQTHVEYAAHGRVLLDRYPLVKEIDFMAGILPADRWTPKTLDSKSFFDPMKIFEKTNIPILAFFGERDKNVDPIQGSAAYRSALAIAGNEHSKVVLFPGVDHDMVPCKNGCMEERAKRTNWRPHRDYLAAMIKWLDELKEGSPSDNP